MYKDEAAGVVLVGKAFAKSTMDKSLSVSSHLTIKTTWDKVKGTLWTVTKYNHYHPDLKYLIEASGKWKRQIPPAILLSHLLLE